MKEALRPIRDINSRRGKTRATNRPLTLGYGQLARDTRRLRVDEGADLGDHDRPKTRADCIDAQRPCPYVSCRYHLYLEVKEETGSIKFNFPNLEVWELKETCALDVAARRGKTLEEVGELANCTRERARQIELGALLKLRAAVEGDADNDDEVDSG